MEVAHQRQLCPTFLLDKMKRIYHPMSILVRREQDKYFFRLKTAVNYGTVKRQAGAEVSRFEVSSLEGFLYCLYCSPLNFLPRTSSKIILNYFQLFLDESLESQCKF